MQDAICILALALIPALVALGIMGRPGGGPWFFGR